VFRVAPTAIDTRPALLTVRLTKGELLGAKEAAYSNGSDLSKLVRDFVRGLIAGSANGSQEAPA
jgi:hypothetical protein